VVFYERQFLTHKIIEVVILKRSLVQLKPGTKQIFFIEFYLIKIYLCLPFDCVGTLYTVKYRKNLKINKTNTNKYVLNKFY